MGAQRFRAAVGVGTNGLFGEWSEVALELPSDRRYC